MNTRALSHTAPCCHLASQEQPTIGIGSARMQLAAGRWKQGVSTLRTEVTVPVFRSPITLGVL